MKINSRATIVYLVQCANYPYYKIGITKELDARMSHFKTSNPFPVHVIDTLEIDIASQVEMLLQQKYEDKNMHGEWFKLEKEDIENISDILLCETTARTWVDSRIMTK